MRLKAQILKDNGLSLSSTAVTSSSKKKIQSKIVTQDQQQLEDLWRIHVEANTYGVYERSINHGYDCKCCTPIVKESVTCPTKEEQSLPRRRGRPRLRR